jgi:nucleoid DNA-binding protein
MAKTTVASLKTEDYVVTVAAALGKTKKETREIIKEFLSQATENTKAGLPSQFVGLGKIEIHEVDGSEKRNPKSGQKVWVDAHQKPRFKFSGKVRNVLRGIEDNSVEAE